MNKLILSCLFLFLIHLAHAQEEKKRFFQIKQTFNLIPGVSTDFGVIWEKKNFQYGASYKISYYATQNHISTLSLIPPISGIELNFHKFSTKEESTQEDNKKPYFGASLTFLVKWDAEDYIAHKFSGPMGSGNVSLPRMTVINGKIHYPVVSARMVLGYIKLKYGMIYKISNNTNFGIEINYGLGGIYDYLKVDVSEHYAYINQNFSTIDGLRPLFTPGFSFSLQF